MYRYIHHVGCRWSPRRVATATHRSPCPHACHTDNRATPYRLLYRYTPPTPATPLRWQLSRYTGALAALPHAAGASRLRAASGPQRRGAAGSSVSGSGRVSGQGDEQKIDRVCCCTERTARYSIQRAVSIQYIDTALCSREHHSIVQYCSVQHNTAQTVSLHVPDASRRRATSSAGPPDAASIAACPRRPVAVALDAAAKGRKGVGDVTMKTTSCTRSLSRDHKVRGQVTRPRARRQACARHAPYGVSLCADGDRNAALSNAKQIFCAVTELCCNRGSTLDNKLQRNLNAMRTNSCLIKTIIVGGTDRHQ